MRGRGSKNARQGVVVCLGNGIELVVVATGTRHRGCQEGTRGRIDLFIDQVGKECLLVFLANQLRTDRQEAGCNYVVGPFLIALDRQQVAGYLLSNKLIERFVTVELVDDVIAVSPGMLIDVVLVSARGFSEACDVHPVPSPELAVTGRGEQFVNQLFNDRLPCGLGRCRLDSFSPLRDVFRSWRQAADHKVEASNEDSRCRIADWLKPLFVELCNHVLVDR